MAWRSQNIAFTSSDARAWSSSNTGFGFALSSVAVGATGVVATLTFRFPATPAEAAVRFFLDDNTAQRTSGGRFVVELQLVRFEGEDAEARGETKNN